MLPIMKFGVVCTFLLSIISLSCLVIKAFSFGKKKLYAAPRGDVKKGIIYAFGKGMMPWEKESAGNHLPTYFAGIFYHMAIFLALLYLALIILDIQPPEITRLFFQVLCLTGLVSGLALLAKRALSPVMKPLSCPDDYVANILVDIFLIAAFLHTLRPVLTMFLFSTAIILFLYIPLGKIRHCFFFFYVRVLFGMFYGRRGVFPHIPYQDATKGATHE